MASDETTMLLDESNTAALRLLVSRLADRDILDVYETTGGKGPIADLAAEQMESRHLDF